MTIVNTDPIRTVNPKKLKSLQRKQRQARRRTYLGKKAAQGQKEVDARMVHYDKPYRIFYDLHQ